MVELSAIKINTGSEYESICPYAVGGIYFSVSSTSPADIFGGTWVALAEKFIKITTDTAEETGGSNTVSHKHVTPISMNYYANVGNFIDFRIESRGLAFYGYEYIEATRMNSICLESLYTNPQSASSYDAWTRQESATGRYAYTDSTSINNQPAYMTVFAWRRTA